MCILRPCCCGIRARGAERSSRGGAQGGGGEGSVGGSEGGSGFGGGARGCGFVGSTRVCLAGASSACPTTSHPMAMLSSASMKTSLGRDYSFLRKIWRRNLAFRTKSDLSHRESAKKSAETSCLLFSPIRVFYLFCFVLYSYLFCFVINLAYGFPKCILMCSDVVSVI